MDWKSNARINQDEKEGTSFELKGFNMRIIIHKVHGFGKSLYLSCPGLLFTQEPLHTENIEDAVSNAKTKISHRLYILTRECKKFLNDNSKIEIVRY